MSYRTQNPVYNTDNGEKPPPSLDDERISPETFSKLAALDLESDAESNSEFDEEYEDYQEPYYRREDRSSQYESYGGSYRPQATSESEEYSRPTPPYPSASDEYRENLRSARAAGHAAGYEPRQSTHTRRAPSPDKEEYRRPHVPYPYEDQYDSRRNARPSSPPPARTRYEPTYQYSSSTSSSSCTRAERLGKWEEGREERERLRERLQTIKENREESLRRKAEAEEEELRRLEERLQYTRSQEEERLRDRLRQRQNRTNERYETSSRYESRERSRYEEPRIYEARARTRPSYRSVPMYGLDYERREVRVPEPRHGERLRVEVPEGWRVVVVVED
ncbi:hypothetical protein OCU04_000710 [Sclerotinia nivalis]|uniref:Uncharacterized protein n=1 Tax=Sclerotinia nivalis TaxID=352851 RepID=A0A9X0AX57_9HELO|nr:hypothetical protein OCU04_000710 [Sclerotinia nivalis]